MRFLAGTLRSALHTLRTNRTDFPRPALIPTNRLSIFGPLSSYAASSFSNQSALAVPSSGAFDRLTDWRFTKRRPSDKPRRKRASLRPPGPYAWVPYVPGQPILPNNPNEGSVKERNEKKRMRLCRTFKLAEDGGVDQEEDGGADQEEDGGADQEEDGGADHGFVRCKNQVFKHILEFLLPFLIP